MMSLHEKGYIAVAEERNETCQTYDIIDLWKDKNLLRAGKTTNIIW